MRHQHSQNFRTDSLNLEPYIEFEKERISRRQFAFHSIRFNLDKDVLMRIQEAQTLGLPLNISRQLLADLREYALISSCLTFYTYYLRGGAQEALMRSVIVADGDVFNQIRSDCLERPNFCHQVAAAHYWIIAQLLSQLRLGAFLRLSLLSWLLALLIVILVIIPLILLLIRVNVWLLLPLLVAALIVLIVLKKLLLPVVRNLLFRQMLSGLIDNKPLQKRFAKGILARFI
ncbi:MAG: hypothetical protein ABI417_09995 [Coleofasciculaceae cyanobacterium]